MVMLMFLSVFGYHIIIIIYSILNKIPLFFMGTMGNAGIKPVMMGTAGNPVTNPVIYDVLRVIRSLIPSYITGTAGNPVTNPVVYDGY